MDKKFTWLLADQVARNGKSLVKNQEYSFSDFPEGVPEEWIRTKAAKLVGDSPKLKSKEDK